jgi:hypothetical protein
MNRKTTARQVQTATTTNKKEKKEKRVRLFHVHLAREPPNQHL